MKENSREEDIEELKRFLYRDELTQYGKRKLINYYEQQEKDYKRVLEMNEVLLKENELLRKDIEGWKKYCKEIEEEQIEKNNKNCELEFEVEKLQKENEYYKECLEAVSKHLDNIDYDQILFAIYEYYISKHKVKDKIEELNKKEKKELKGMKGQDRYFVKQTYQNKRMILQELIEEREEK